MCSSPLCEVNRRKRIEQEARLTKLHITVLPAPGNIFRIFSSLVVVVVSKRNQTPGSRCASADELLVHYLNFLSCFRSGLLCHVGKRVAATVPERLDMVDSLSGNLVTPTETLRVK